MRIFIPLALITAVYTHPAQAVDCSDAASQKEMTDCARQNYARNDAQLNANFALLKLRLADDAQTEQQLVTAQRNWIAYRDAECAFASNGVEGGSFFGVVHTNCLNRLTQNRNADFDRYLKCQEGDLSCPTPK